MAKKQEPQIFSDGTPTDPLEKLSHDDLLGIYNIIRKERGLPEIHVFNGSRAYLIRRIETYYNRLRSRK